MSWKPRVATADMVDSCTAIPQFFARRPSLFCLYNPPLLESIYHYISTMDSWIPVASHQMASPSLPIVSLQRCGKAATTHLWSNKSIVLGAEITQQEQTQLGSATLQHEMAGDTCQCQYPADAFAKSSQIRWKKSPFWAALSGWRLAIFCDSESILPGETVDIGNHRPSDNQIRSPPDSGAANPDTTPFYWQRLRLGHLGLRNSRNPSPSKKSPKSHQVFGSKVRVPLDPWDPHSWRTKGRIGPTSCPDSSAVSKCGVKYHRNCVLVCGNWSNNQLLDIKTM